MLCMDQGALFGQAVISMTETLPMVNKMEKENRNGQLVIQLTYMMVTGLMIHNLAREYMYGLTETNMKVTG